MYKKSLLALSISVSSVPFMLATQAVADNKASMLEEVVVTAQRKQQSSQDVPISLMAVSGDSLSEKNLTQVSELTLATPGLQLGRDDSLAVRGVGSVVFSNTLDSSVALSIDEVNYGRPGLGGALFNDIERVEVLYGPQGLLFGKNASAGLINITSKKPTFDELSGDVEFQYSQLPTTPNDAETYTAKGNVNIPINDHSAMRINAIYTDRDMINDVRIAKNPAKPNQSIDDYFEQKYVKVKYLNEISDSLSLYVIGDYSKQSGVAGIYDWSYRSVGEGSPLNDVFAADGIVPSEDNLNAVIDGGIFRDQDSGGLQGTVSYLFENDMELINIAAWRYYERDQALDTDYSTQDGLDNGNSQRFDQFSNELRLVFPTIGDLSGQVGLYYFNSVLDHEGYAAGAAGTPGFPVCFVGQNPCTYENYNLTLLGSDNDYEMDTTSTAIFGQVDYALTDKWTIIAGGRLTHDELELDLTSGVNADKYIVNIGGTPGRYQEENSVTNFSWKLGTQYFLQDDLMLYASASTGYKAPGFNDGPTPTGELAVNEETVMAYEMGIKSSWLDNRLQVNASVFHQNFDDYQVQSIDAASQNFLIQNAAEVTSKGAEISVTALLLEGLTLSSSISLLDSTYDDFPGAQCYPQQEAPGCEGPDARRFNAEGMDLPLAPETTATTQLRYEFSLNNGLEAFVEGSWYYRSDVYYSIVNDPGTQLGDINVYGLTAGLYSPQGWKLSLYCKNCTDERYPGSINAVNGDANANIPTYNQSSNYNSFRTIGVNVGYEF